MFNIKFDPGKRKYEYQINKMRFTIINRGNYNWEIITCKRHTLLFPFIVWECGECSTIDERNLIDKSIGEILLYSLTTK